MVTEFAVDKSACNYLKKELQECYKEYPIRRFIGHCSPIYMELERCILNQQELRRDASLKRTNEKREKLSKSNTNKDA